MSGGARSHTAPCSALQVPPASAQGPGHLSEEWGRVCLQRPEKKREKERGEAGSHMESPPRLRALVHPFGEQALNPTMCPALGWINILQTAPGKSPTRPASCRGKCSVQAEVLLTNQHLPCPVPRGNGSSWWTCCLQELGQLSCRESRLRCLCSQSCLLGRIIELKLCSRSPPDLKDSGLAGSCCDDRDNSHAIAVRL